MISKLTRVASGPALFLRVGKLRNIREREQVIETMMTRTHMRRNAWHANFKKPTTMWLFFLLFTTAVCGNVSAEIDQDGDGFMVGNDCNDTDPSVWPGAPEACDGVDDNCDGFADEDCQALPVCTALTNTDGRNYAFCPQLTTMPEARISCLLLGMDLVEINSQAENDFIFNNIGVRDTWIGATDAHDPAIPYLSPNNSSPHEGVFRWIRRNTEFWMGYGFAGQPLNGHYANWGITSKGPQPNNLNGNYYGPNQDENCAVIRRQLNGRWDDIGCTNRKANAFCEEL